MIKELGGRWRGAEFHYVVTQMHLQPAQTAATWSLNDIRETYYHLRLNDLTSPTGGYV